MLIIKALEFAGHKHKDQVRRESGLPYVLHPASVAFMISNFKESKRLEELMVAAILHDTLEDTDTTFGELAKEFTPLVATLVHELTSDDEIIAHIGKNEYLKKKLVGISSYALVIKLVDRLHNIMDSPTDSYKEDTAELLGHIEKHRKLSGTHQNIISEIRERL